MVGVKGQGGGEGPDVGDERSVAERRCRVRQEDQLAHFAVSRGGRAVRVLPRWVLLLYAESNHLARDTDDGAR